MMSFSNFANEPKKRRWLFAHDHRFIKRGDIIGSESGFGARMWERYLPFCDELTVVGREGRALASKRLLTSSREGVRFNLLPKEENALERWQGKGTREDILRAEIECHDVVIARIPSVIGLQANDIAKKLKKPVALEVVGCAWSSLWDYGSIAGKIFAPVQWLKMRQAVREANNVIYVTERYLQSRYSTKAQNVANASNVELPAGSFDGQRHYLSNEVINQRLKRISSRALQPTRLGLIGSLHVRSKGIQFVLAALSHLKETDHSLRFHVLGGGDTAPWIAEAKRHGVDDIVSFDGTLPEGDAVFKWLDEVDIYLQPSLQEGLPRALIEAMSRGCPAIGSDCAGIPELLSPSFIVPQRNVEELKNAILRLSSNDEMMAEQAKRNFEVAHDYIGPDLQQRRFKFFENLRR